MAGFCKVVASQIWARLVEENIYTYWIDLNNLVSVDHVVLISEYFFQGKLRRFLIDPTFIQFTKRDGQQLLTFSEWPSEKLPPNVVQELLLRGMIEIDDQKFLLYLNSFGTEHELLLLDQYLMDYRLEKVSKKVSR